MVTRDERIDAYLAAAPDFAKPVLTALRSAIHAACPDVVETIKWRNPSFEYHGLLCAFAAFQRHCSFGFWQDQQLRELPGLAAILEAAGRTASVDELPSRRAFAKAVQQAVVLRAATASAPKQKATAKPKPAKVAMHPEFERALAASKRATTAFAAFPPGAQREYLEWIAEAKQDTTRARRIDQAVEWIADGKRRHWKYE